MSIFRYELAEEDVNPLPEVIRSQFTIIDSVGEAIHVHLRNLRINFSIDEFETFAHTVEQAQQKIDEPGDEDPLAMFELSSGEMCRIERSKDGLFYIHMNRARIEMSTQEFRCFMRVIREAQHSLHQAKREEAQRLVHQTNRE